MAKEIIGTKNGQNFYVGTDNPVTTPTPTTTGGSSNPAPASPAPASPAPSTAPSVGDQSNPYMPGTPQYDSWKAGNPQAYASTTPNPNAPLSVPTAPKSAQDTMTDFENSSAIQTQIQSIRDMFAGELTKEDQNANQRLNQTNSMDVARGLVGSPQSASDKETTTTYNTQQRQAILDKESASIAQVLSNADDRALKIAELNQNKYQQDYQNWKTQHDELVTQAKDDFETLSKTVHKTWADYKAADPQGAQNFLTQTGFTEWDAAFKWNASKTASEQIQWDKTPQKTATGFLFTGIDPVTNKPVTQEVPASVGADWAVSPGNMYQDTLMYNKATGEYKTLQAYNQAIPGNISKLAPDGTQGGQCGDFVHTIVDNVPSMGDTIASKDAMIDQYGVKAGKWQPKIGDVIVQNIGPNGHAAVVNSINPDGTITISESNYSGDGTVNNSRTLAKNDPSIYGAYTKGQLKSTVADGSMTPRELKLRQQIASLQRTEKLIQATDVSIASRRTTIVNNTIKSLYGSATKNPVAIYNNSAQVINRINPALQSALDSGTVAKNVPDLDLIDAYVQIARGGQAITEAQVDTLLQGLGISAKFDIATQKVSGSATLDDATRNQLAELSKNIYDEQGKSAQAAVIQLNKQLKANGIPDEMLLKKPVDIAGMKFDSATGMDAQTLQNLQSQLGQDEVLAQDSSGNVVAATQEDIDNGTYTPIQ